MEFLPNETPMFTVNKEAVKPGKLSPEPKVAGSNPAELGS
jgi:hypothetical protein